ncbi:CapA family protein [soil metagenome]
MRKWSPFLFLGLFAGSLYAPPARAQALVVALGGDMIGPYRAIDKLDDPGFAAVLALFRSADVGFANQEGAIFDMEGFDGFPAAENGGGYPRVSVGVASTLRAGGIGLVSKANNHATDWGTQGLLATLATLRKADIVQAGAGAGPEAACAPAMRDGKAALVSAATTFPPMSLPVAAFERRGVPAPAGQGICAIHVQPVRRVTAEQLASLHAIAGPVALPTDDGQGVRIGDQIFRAAGAPGLTWAMKTEDVAPVLASIQGAHAKGAPVIFAVHAHETAGSADGMPARDFEPLVLHRANEAPDGNNVTPADFVPALFHQAVDAGADIVVRTGPHLLGGIEIYNGRPIFYSLGSLIFDFGGRRTYMATGGQAMSFPDQWYETIVPKVTFSRGRPTEIRLYPATIDPGAGPGGGLPHLATGAAAKRILSRLAELSAAYGTHIEREGDVGIIRP